MNQTDAIVFLKDIYRTLAHQSDLSPDNPQVNRCLGQLVATLRQWQSNGFGHKLADHPELAHIAEALPQLCAKAECEMEKWWCRQILASDCPGAQALAAFWYLDEYAALCRSELQLVGENARRGFAFLGSGALPVTAIMLAKSCPDARISCVDCDEDSCALSEKLLQLLGLSGRIEVKSAHAEHYEARPDETLICASLLDAPSLFELLPERRVRHLIIRDAEGPYRFCYRPARLPGAAYAELAKSEISHERINTSRYYALRGIAGAGQLETPADQANMLS